MTLLLIGSVTLLGLAWAIQFTQAAVRRQAEERRLMLLSRIYEDASAWHFDRARKDLAIADKYADAVYED